MNAIDRLDAFSAPAFAGIVFVDAIASIGRDDWTPAIFSLACFVGYWSRMIYLFWREARSPVPTTRFAKEKP